MPVMEMILFIVSYFIKLAILYENENHEVVYMVILLNNNSLHLTPYIFKLHILLLIVGST